MEQFVPTHARVIQLGSVQTQELLSITELEPSNEAFFIGKRINRDGSLTEYPKSHVVVAERGAGPGHHPAFI